LKKNSKKKNTEQSTKQSTNKKKVQIRIICIVILVLLITSMFYIFSLKDESKEQLNNTEISEIRNVNIAGTKMVGDIEFSNIRINLISRNKCEFLADIRNTADKFLEQTKVRIKAINSKGEVDEVFGGIVTELANYEPNEFKITVLSNLMDIKDVEIEIVN